MTMTIKQMFYAVVVKLGLFASFVGFILASGTCAADKSGQAILTDGSRIQGTLVALDENGGTLLKTANGTRQLNAKELIHWGEFRDQPQGSSVILAGGSTLAGNIFAISETVIHFESPVFSAATLNRKQVRGILWRPPADALRRDQLVSRLVNESRTRDQLWMANGDELEGEVTPAGDPARIAGHGLVEIGIVPRAGSQSLVIPVEGVVAAGLASSAVNAERPKGSCFLLGLRDGSRMWTTKISRTEMQVQLSLVGGETLVADAELFWGQVTAIQVLGTHVTYLSDLPTLGYKHIPFLSTAWEYGQDRNVLGGMLRNGGRIYPRGIGMHSTSRLAYELNGQFRRFEADIAVDDAAGGRGSTVFRLFVERGAADESNSRWQVAYQSPIIRGGDQPLPVSVDVSGIARLALVVDFADRGDEGDHADWLNARLVP